MRVFKKNYKFNFVDKNDVYVGYSSSQHCCENFGWFFSNKIPVDCADDVVEGFDPLGYVFDPEFFALFSPGHEYNDDNYAVFKLVKSVRVRNDAEMRAAIRNNLMDLPVYLVLYNHHNGYYCHGFTCSVGGEVVQSGSL